MRIPIIMPQLGQSIAEATVLQWLKQPGEAVEADEPILEVETDKSSFEIPSPCEGTMAAVEVEAGQTVPCGTVLGHLEGEADAAEPDTGKPEEPARRDQSSREVLAATEPDTVDLEGTSESLPDPQKHQHSRTTKVASRQVRRQHLRQAQGQEGGFLSPRVRSLMAEHGLHAAELPPGSGSDGRVTARDVEALIQARAGSTMGPHAELLPLPDVPYRTLALSRARRNIGEILTRSVQEVPQAVTIHEADFAALAAARERLMNRFDPEADGRLTWLPFLLRAFCDAAREFPLVNATLHRDKVRVYDQVNLGVAVSLDTDSLIVPVIEAADRLSFHDLVRTANDLIARARSKRLRPAETENATATVSSFGGFGAIAATPILLPPQAVMFGIGKIEKRPVVKGDGLAVSTRAYLTLTFDHRLIDGAYAGRFMSAVCAWIESVDARALMGRV